MKEGFAIIVDIGKTLAKVSLWSRDGEMIARETRPNETIEVEGIRRLDAAGIEDLLISSLTTFANHPVKYIVPVAHGAGIAVLKDGDLAIPPLDYEQELPTQLAADYNAVRAPFAETGSPRLPAGLNFGAQLFWLEDLHPGLIAQGTLLPWAQYWTWFLTGQARTEATSMGCHSDLWAPATGTFSSLAVERGWAENFAPIAAPGDVAGTLKPELAERTGLGSDIRVLTGLHDSNAALHAARGFHEIADREATILSTGTWFIAMRLAKNTVDLSALPEARDCLVNVDALGNPVPSARFMGGREIESLIQIDTRQVDIKPDQLQLLAAVPAVLAQKAMVIPTLAPGNGPFPNHEGGWVNRPDDWYARRAGACLYAAMVADAALDLIGSHKCLLVEGRFAEAEVFVRALAALRPETKVYIANAHNDVSFGALRLIDPEMRPRGGLIEVAPLEQDIAAYKSAWQRTQKTST